ncbi:hypothetical protein AN641_07920 [Candidatus Epulonipiscioides gigas]|nr:hypothetical protein AN641_07920 [Epulopiscium sp. SCG-C07WGA-EpuloA2]
MIKSELQKALELQNIQELTQMQQEAIEKIMSNNDVVIASPTGSGKTLAFLLPLMSQVENIKQCQVLILAPTSELIIQILEQTRLLIKNSQLPITCSSLIGNPSRVIENIKKQKPNILVSTPERALDLIAQKKLPAHTIKSLVIDEADYFFNNEHNAKIKNIIKALQKQTQIILCSATLTQDNYDFLKAPSFINVQDKVNKNISHQFFVTEFRKKFDILNNILNKQAPKSSLVFVNNIHEAQIVYDKLLHNGFKASILTSNQNKQERANSLLNFRNNKTNVLISSDVSARGLDVPNISHVISLDVPPNSNSYIHRAGRCARFNNFGTSICIITKGEIKTISDYEKNLSISFECEKNNPT